MKNRCSNITGELTDYALGQLDTAARSRVEEHLASCSRCARELSRVSALVDGARALPEERVTPSLHDRIIARIRTEMAAQEPSARPIQGTEEEPPISLRDRVLLTAGFVGYRLRQSVAVRSLLAAAAVLVLSLLILHVLSDDRETAASYFTGDGSAVTDETAFEGIDEEIESKPWRLPRSGGRADLNIDGLSDPDENFPSPGTEDYNPFEIQGVSEIPDDDIRTKVARENTLELGRYRLFARSNALCKTRVLKGRGGDQQTTYLVDRGLRWLHFQQEEDGSWDPVASSHSPARELGGVSEARVGLTALAVAAFLSDGHSETAGTYKDTVSNGINFLLAARDSLGQFGKVKDDPKTSLFNQSVCVLVLAENYMLSEGKNEDDLRLGINRLMSMAHRSTDDETHQTFSDTWAAMALRTALLTGLDSDGDLAGVCRTVESRVELLAKEESSAGVAASDVPPLCSAGMEAVDALFVPGEPGQDQIAFPDLRKPETLFNLLEDPDLCEPSFLFFVGTALCEKEQPVWAEWNRRVKEYLSDSQKTDGSWLAGGDWPWIDGGDIYTSSLSILTLQVYYRFIKLEENCP